MRLIAALFTALATGAVGWLCLRIGFDPLAQGGLLLAAHLTIDSSGSFASASTPLANAMLGGWMAVGGASVASLVRLDAIALAVTAGAGAWWGHPRGGPKVAIAWGCVVLAAAPLPWAVAVAAAMSIAWAVGPARAKGFALGVGGVVVAALEPRTALGLLPLAIWALPRERDARRNAWIGAGGTALLLMAAGVLLDGLTSAWTLGVLAPFDGLAERLVSGEVGRFLRTAIGGALLHQPFGSWPPTGEVVPPAWPGQGAMRATSLRIVVIVVLIGLAWTLRRWIVRRDRQEALTLCLFLCALIWLGGRGDVMGLRQAFLPLGAALLSMTGSLRDRAWLPSVAIVVLALPLTTEAVVRGIASMRSGLVEWEDEQGGVLIEERRAGRWSEIRRQLVPRGGEPALVWPPDPGAHWILGTSPLTPDADLPSGPAADRRIADALMESPPRLVLLGPDPRLLGHRLLATLPRTWELLRDRYRLAGMVRFERDDLRLLMPFDGRGPDPLARSLPAVELTVSDERTPALRAGFQIGQSFRLGPTDLRGFAVRARTGGTDLAVDFRIQVWQERGGGFDAALLSERVSTTIAGDGAVLWFRTPLSETAGRGLAITLELRSEVAEEIRLDWYVRDERDEPDFYPEGAALIGLEPTAADLYFLVY